MYPFRRALRSHRSPRHALLSYPNYYLCASLQNSTKHPAPGFELLASPFSRSTALETTGSFDISFFMLTSNRRLQHLSFSCMLCKPRSAFNCNCRSRYGFFTIIYGDCRDDGDRPVLLCMYFNLLVIAFSHLGSIKPLSLLNHTSAISLIKSRLFHVITFRVSSPPRHAFLPFAIAHPEFVLCLLLTVSPSQRYIHE